MDNNFPEKGSKEYHIRMLKKVETWLQRMVDNPRNNTNTKLLTEEIEAIQFALKELE